jgi:hypothetical protein
MELSSETIQNHIPKYLTEPLQRELLENLKSFPEKFNYYWYRSKTEAEILQGDGWRGLELIDFETKEHRSVKGIVLSNSCDIAPENKRDNPSRVVFAPLIRLSSLKALWNDAGIPKAVVEDKVSNIRLQRNTKIFYLPAGAGLEDEYIAHLDDVYSYPASVLLSNEKRQRLFALTTAGFYLFIIKLTVHFCRLHEGVLRTSEQDAGAGTP